MTIEEVGAGVGLRKLWHKARGEVTKNRKVKHTLIPGFRAGICLLAPQSLHLTLFGVITCCRETPPASRWQGHPDGAGWGQVRDKYLFAT